MTEVHYATTFFIKVQDHFRNQINLFLQLEKLYPNWHIIKA